MEISSLMALGVYPIFSLKSLLQIP